MDTQTIDILTLGISAISAIGGAVATVASIYTVKLSRDSYRLQQEQQKAEMPQLHVRVYPTRNGSRQLAQIIVVNQSRRPAHIQMWWVGNKETGRVSGEVLPAPANGYGAILPKVLAEQERCDFLVELDAFDWKTMDQIGVMDVANRPWLASEEEVKRFIATAEKYSPKESEHPVPPQSLFRPSTGQDKPIFPS